MRRVASARGREGTRSQMQDGEELWAKKIRLTPLYVAEKIPSPAPFAAAILGMCVNGSYRDFV
jgi:hypothetical protein